MSDILEEILANTSFKIESVIVAGIDTSSDFINYTLAFSNDLSVTSMNLLNTVEGCYMVHSELEVMLNLNFTCDILNLLNRTWTVTSYTENSITLESSLSSIIKLELKKI